MYYVLLYMYDIGASIARAVHAYTNHHYWNNSSVELRIKRLNEKSSPKAAVH
jgi:hypothetical protein